MKTISEPVTSWSEQFQCAGCHARLEACTDDIKVRTVDRWQADGYGDGGDMVKAKQYYVVCPHCDTIYLIDQDTIGLALRKRLGA